MRYLLICLLLAGCVSAEDEARERAERAAARQAAYHQKCLGYGFKPGTVEYGQCRQNFDAMEAQDRTARKAVILQHFLLTR